MAVSHELSKSQDRASKIMADVEGQDDFVAAEKVSTKNDMSIWKLAVFCNIIQLSYAFMSMFGKDALVNQQVRIIDFAILRSILMIAVSYFYVLYKDKYPPAPINGVAYQPIDLYDVPKEYTMMLRIRSWTGVFQNLIIGIGLMVVPLVVAFVVCNLAPFFTVLLAYCYLKENFLWVEVVAMFVSFGAIGLIAYGSPSEDNEQNKLISKLDNRIFYYMDNTSRYVLGILILVLCAFLNSITFITSRQMKKLHWSIIQFNYGLIGVYFVGGIMMIDLIYQCGRFGINDPLNPISWPL
jgi:drug/metabolite transporter (DMT)-like permease